MRSAQVTTLAACEGRVMTVRMDVPIRLASNGRKRPSRVGSVSVEIQVNNAGVLLFENEDVLRFLPSRISCISSGNSLDTTFSGHRS